MESIEWSALNRIRFSARLENAGFQGVDPIDPAQPGDWILSRAAWAFSKAAWARQSHQTPTFGVMHPELRAAVRESVEAALAQETTPKCPVGVDLETNTEMWWTAFSVDFSEGSFELCVLYSRNDDGAPRILATGVVD